MVACSSLAGLWRFRAGPATSREAGLEVAVSLVEASRDGPSLLGLSLDELVLLELLAGWSGFGVRALDRAAE